MHVENAASPDVGPDGGPLMAVELAVELVLVAVHQAHAPPRLPLLLPAAPEFHAPIPSISLTAWQPGRREQRISIISDTQPSQAFPTTHFDLPLTFSTVVIPARAGREREKGKEGTINFLISSDGNHRVRERERNLQSCSRELWADCVGSDTVWLWLSLSQFPVGHSVIWHARCRALWSRNL